MNGALPKIRESSTEISVEKPQGRLPGSLGGDLVVVRVHRIGESVIRRIPTHVKRLAGFRHSGSEARDVRGAWLGIAFREVTQDRRLQALEVPSQVSVPP